MSVNGRIHSIETCGAVDGPGIRYVVFFQGCELRCRYCHNPDSWDVRGGREISSDALFEDIMKYYSFIHDGGVTLTGGEPLLQPDFACDILRRCKDERLHTAVDTSGHVRLDTVYNALKYTDLLLLDVKTADSALSKGLTGGGLDSLVDFIEYANANNIKMWIRHVIVPTLTADRNQVKLLGDFLWKYRANIEKVELLPFHKMGEYKWEKLRYNYKLREVLPPSREEMHEYAEILAKKGLKVFVK